MRLIKRIVPFSIAVITLTAVIICVCVRITWVNRYELVDSDVKNWFEEIARKEKSKSYSTGSMFISVATTRNSIACYAMFPSEFGDGDTLYGFTTINGVRFVFTNNALDDIVPKVFAGRSKKETSPTVVSFLHN